MNEKKWSIRKAAFTDASALKKCMKDAYAEYSSRLQGELLPPMMVDYAEEIRLYPVWIAESEMKLVGGLILMPESDYMTLANLAVHPQFRGNGLGRGLIEFAEAEAKRAGYSELRLTTHVLLIENVSLYQYLGWSKIGRDEYRVYMKKNLE